MKCIPGGRPLCGTTDSAASALASLCAHFFYLPVETQLSKLTVDRFTWLGTKGGAFPVLPPQTQPPEPRCGECSLGQRPCSLGSHAALQASRPLLPDAQHSLKTRLFPFPLLEHPSSSPSLVFLLRDKSVACPPSSPYHGVGGGQAQSSEAQRHLI